MAGPCDSEFQATGKAGGRDSNSIHDAIDAAQQAANEVCKNLCKSSAVLVRIISVDYNPMSHDAVFTGSYKCKEGKEKE